MADNTGSDHAVIKLPEDEPAPQVDGINFLTFVKLVMPDSEDHTVEQSLDQLNVNRDADQTILTPEEKNDQLIDDTNPPVKEDATIRDAANVDQG